MDLTKCVNDIEYIFCHSRSTKNVLQSKENPFWGEKMKKVRNRDPGMDILIRVKRKPPD